MKTNNSTPTKRELGDMSYADAYALKSDLKQEIKSDVVTEIRRWICRRLWVPVTAVLAVFAFFGWSTFEGLKRVRGKVLDEAETNFQRTVQDRFSDADISNRMDQILQDKMAAYVELRLAPLVVKADSLQDQLDALEPINRNVRQGAVIVNLHTTREWPGGVTGGTASGARFLRHGETLLELTGVGAVQSGGNDVTFGSNLIEGHQSVAGLNQADTLTVWNSMAHDFTVLSGTVSLMFDDSFCGHLSVPPQTANAYLTIPITNRPFITNCEQQVTAPPPRNYGKAAQLLLLHRQH